MLKWLALSFALVTPIASCTVEIDAHFDCNDICGRYADCFDDSYDVSACADRCEDNADASEDFDQKADLCENCLDDRSCTGSFACTAECSGIVP